MPAGAALRDLRALRHDPPGRAKRGGRRTTFQSALEQCEQFLGAARDVGYATRPVQLFYALSQAGRAMLAASPHTGNQAWKVSGHGLTANTNAGRVADVAITATRAGLFPAVAAALNMETLVPEEPTVLGDLWPLLPESAFVPLAPGAMLPALLFFPQGDPVFSTAEIAWIPDCVKDLYGSDVGKVKEHLDNYPALREGRLRVSPSTSPLEWASVGPGLSLGVEWRKGSPPLMLGDGRMVDDVGAVSYRFADDLVITPAIGSMSTGLHPILALWAVLLALSSLARYEPAAWATMIDIDRSAEASAIEHLLEEALTSVPEATLHMLSNFD